VARYHECSIEEIASRISDNTSGIERAVCARSSGSGAGELLYVARLAARASGRTKMHSGEGAADSDKFARRSACRGALCVIVAWRVVTDTHTLVSWRARPRSFVALRDCMRQLNGLGWLAGKRPALVGRDRFRVSRRLWTSSHCDRSRRTPHRELTYLLPRRTGACVPDMQVRITWTRTGRGAASKGRVHIGPAVTALRSHAGRELAPALGADMM